MNRQPNSTAKITALYSRLSKEDELSGDSLSITHQRQILETHANQQGFTNLKHYCDDGTTGVRFDRAAWNQLIEDVQADRVGAILTKDMTRVGRDHIQVGLHLELFRQRGIRFIALGNNIDSINPESLEYAPFINIMSEMYARDTSRKIKAVLHAKGNSGKRTTNAPVYGYKLSPDDKYVWIIDSEPAAVVRRIFQMAMDGMGPYQIARQLTAEEVEKPSYYFVKHNMTGARPSKHDLSEPHIWCGSTVTTILSRPEYCGHTVNFRTRKESYKDKNYKRNPKENWKFFPNTHEPIIEQGIFDTVQRLQGTPRRIDTTGEANPLTGLVFCAQCGGKMYNSRKSAETAKHKVADHYTCGTYGMSHKRFNVICSQHYIRTEVIRKLVLDAIREISGYVRRNEAEFVEKIREASTVQQAETAKAHQKQLAKNERRVAELNHLFQRVYEDNANGKLSDERYEILSGSYEREQAELKQQNAALQAEVDAFTADSEKTGRFIELVRRYSDFEELTTPMLNEFIHKILVHEADKSSGERVQEVDIHFNFIGNFDIPRVEPAPAPEELAEQDMQRQKRARQREANRRFYAKQKEKQEQEKREQEQQPAKIA